MVHLETTHMEEFHEIHFEVNVNEKRRIECVYVKMIDDMYEEARTRLSKRTECGETEGF